jgi:hypothetical protein
MTLLVGASLDQTVWFCCLECIDDGELISPTPFITWTRCGETKLVCGHRHSADASGRHGYFLDNRRRARYHLRVSCSTFTP